MKMTVLALSLSAITSTLYAAEPQPPVSAEADQAAPVTEAQANTATESTEAPVADTGQVTENSQADQAASALQKKESDATQETNLQEVFTSNERQYSLIKKGVFSSYYDLD